MYYYTKDDMGNIIHFCDNIKIADKKVKKGEWKSFFETDEEIVMQGDNSGYVLASQYIAPPANNTYAPSLEEQVQANAEAILDIYSMLGGDL